MYDVITFLIINFAYNVIQKREYLQKEKRYSQLENAILLYSEKSFKQAAVIFYFIGTLKLLGKWYHISHNKIVATTLLASPTAFSGSAKIQSKYLLLTTRNWSLIEYTVGLPFPFHNMKCSGKHMFFKVELF